MKIAIVIYKSMSIIMIVACIVLAVLGITAQSNWLYIIIPIIVVLAFVISLFIEKDKSKLMTSIYTGHLLVVLTVIQMLLTFKVELATSLVIFFITLIMMSAMVISLKYMMKKIGAANAKN
ncbi:MAG: hypothetical protein KAQ68_09570 [Clostridiales bacterium]|nr:hypothetical protein [Clostridiales bacterium]